MRSTERGRGGEIREVGCHRECSLSCQEALTHKGKHVGVAAHSNKVTELPLSPSHSAIMPSGVALQRSLWRHSKHSNVNGRADTRKRTLKGGGGALEVGDHRLLEDSGERGGALDSDEVAPETASDGWDGDGERESRRVNGR